MNIKRLVIENFKSIERIELIEPNPFTVFVGPNGSGKSNIFEALEYINYSKSIDDSIDELFGGTDNFINRKLTSNRAYFSFECEFDSFTSKYIRFFGADAAKSLGLPSYGGVSLKNGEINGAVHAPSSSKNYHNLSEEDITDNPSSEDTYKLFFQKFSRLFIGNNKYEKLKRNSDIRLSLSAFNLEKVLGRILTDERSKVEIFEWLNLFVPGFYRLEISTNNLTGEESLLFYDKAYERPFARHLISDGTYNILALITAVYQSNEPQFLCIEEPENGLHPQVLETLVDFFRQQCKEKGHFIWLNTHSEAIVRHLTTDEIILVNKRNGATQTRQIKGRNIYNLPTDQAWLTGALGDGLPW